MCFDCSYYGLFTLTPHGVHRFRTGDFKILANESRFRVSERHVNTTENKVPSVQRRNTRNHVASIYVNSEQTMIIIIKRVIIFLEITAQ